MTDRYENPLITRYASKEMSKIFSDDQKFSTWRKLWIALAESEKELGLDVITQEQIDEMKQHVYDINYDVAVKREKEVRHDVMAHVFAFSQLCPKAAPIIHLGATSCYVTDNADLINFYQALCLVRKKLVNTIEKLADFAEKYKALPTLGFTHLQPAQLTTVGKRATLWAYELVLDYHNLEFVIENTMLRGVKGTTGTQASFLNLFDGDHEKVRQLEKLVVKKMGFEKAFAVTGQTYTRKYDSNILNVLSGIAQSASKFANDIRILQSIKEVEEPFEKSQIGSSAMAYKRNPMRSERICALSRYVMSLPVNTAFTAATQWMERTLDDSANRRIVIAQAFLAVDAILNLYMNISENLVVNDKVIEKHIREELPFMATENILMACVKAGGNRQELHERIRELSMQASYAVKKEGKACNLIELIKNDDAFARVRDNIDEMINPMFLTDVGWLLSFASFAGIMILGPRIVKFFWGAKKPGFVVQTIITTISATIMTLPITLYYYGAISLISVVANLLILPTLPYAMGLTFLTGLVTGVPILEIIVGFLATKLLDLHIFLVGCFSTMESLLVEIEPYNAKVFWLYILILAPFLIGLLRRKMLKFGKRIILESLCQDIVNGQLQNDRKP